jgi:Tol biopolymer transport system component
MSVKELGRLESWKEIGAYLQRDVRTLRRWEKEEGLPVHRHSHKSRSSVYAYPAEIDAWRAGRKVVPEPAPARSLWKIPAFALTMLLCLIMVGNGSRPVSAQQPRAGKAARQVWVGAWPDSISPDGRYFSFTDWQTHGDLAVHDITTGTNRRLTNNAERSEVEFSVFSPDGRQIAYQWNSWSSEPKDELRVIPAAGGQPRTIAAVTEGYIDPAGWTPDGKQLLVIRALPDRTKQLALLSVQDGSIHILKSFAWQSLNPRFSPDGRWIVYAMQSSEKPARDIFVLATDGSREIAVVQNPADDSTPVWSLNGSRIFFLSNRTGRQALWSVPFGDGKPGKEELVKADLSGARSMFMAPSGTLYYSAQGEGGRNIYTAELGVDMKVSKAPVLANLTPVNSNGAPSLSPDGDYLAYCSGGRGLVIRTLATGEEHVVPAQAQPCSGPWFPDGRSLLITSKVPQGPGPNFYRLDLATRKAELLFRSAAPVHGFSLSPDGKTVFYSEPSRLVRFDIETRRETELKKFEVNSSLYDVAVSPDGKQLAYVFWNGGPTQSIEVMPAAGGPSREVFLAETLSRYNSLAWASDQTLLFTKPGAGDNGESALWRVPVAGGPAEQVGLSIPGLSSPQIRPGGRRIFFVSNDSGPRQVWALENFLPATDK